MIDSLLLFLLFFRKCIVVNMSNLISRIVNNKHFKNGVPFFLFIFGGAYALREFRSVRYDSELNPKAKKFIKPEEAFKDLNNKSTVKFKKTENTLEDDLEVYDSKVDLENWENKRGPRAWEPESIQQRPVRRFEHSAPSVKELTQQS